MRDAVPLERLFYYDRRGRTGAGTAGRGAGRGALTRALCAGMKIEMLLPSVRTISLYHPHLSRPASKMKKKSRQHGATMQQTVHTARNEYASRRASAQT